MLNDHRAIAPSKIVVSPLAPPQVAASADHEVAHTDYDLQPLRVQPLQHYLEPAGDGRFHVR